MPLDPPLDLPPEAVRAALAPLRHDFSVAIDAPGNAFAVGAIVRVAHNFLAREVILIGDAPFYEKASMGMEKYERVERLADEAAFYRTSEGYLYNLTAFAMSGTKLPYLQTLIGLVPPPAPQ